MLPPVCVDALLALPTPEQHVQGEAMLIFLRWREELTQQVYARGVPEMRARCVGISAVDRISLGRRWRAKLSYPLRTTDMHRLFDGPVTTRIATAILLTLRISIRLHHITLQGRHHAPHPTHRGRTAWSKGRDRRHRPSQRGTFAPNSFPSLHSAIFFWN